MNKILMSIWIAAGALSADTLILRDGARIEGTMSSASGRNMSFVDAEGRKRDFSLTNVKEIHFTDTEYSGTRGRTEIPGMATASTVDLVQRLTDDIAEVMERATLSPRQRQMLKDATNVISRAGHDLREGLSLTNRREVQMALDNVRYVMNSSGIRTADRRTVLADITTLREKYPEFASASGARTRK